jgi:hypothetical protein
MSKPKPEPLEITDYLDKIDAMIKAGDKHPGVTIIDELEEYIEKVRDGERELDEIYFENQLWLLYMAGLEKGGDGAMRALFGTPKPRRKPGPSRR